MTKLDKKIISFVLIAILILANFAPIVNAAGDEIVPIKDGKLLEELNYCDKNGDGKISKSEIEEVRYLNIDEEITDLSGIEYAVNLENLSINYGENSITIPTMDLKHLDYVSLIFNDSSKVDLSFLDKCNNFIMLHVRSTNNVEVDFSKIGNCKNLLMLDLNNIIVKDFSKLGLAPNLESIFFSNNTENKANLNMQGIEKISKLDSLLIDNANLKNVNSLGQIKNLKVLLLSNVTGISDLSCLEESSDMRSFEVQGSDLADISFMKNWENLNSINLSNTQVKDLSALQGKTIEYASLSGIDVPATELAKLFTPRGYTAYVGENFYMGNTVSGVFDEFNWTYEVENETILNARDGVSMQAKQVGTTNIKIMKDEKVYKTVKINVQKTTEDVTLGNESKSQFVEPDMVLKANGDLLKVYASEGKAEKIDSNVKKHVYGFVYGEGDDNTCFKYTFTSKKDGTVKYVFNGIESEMRYLKDVSDGGYLGTDGKFYKVQLDGKFNVILENVEKVVGDYLVTNDGKTYNKDGKLVVDFAIKDAVGFYIVDNNNVVWSPMSDGKVYQTDMTDFKKVAIDYDPIYFSGMIETQDGEIKQVWGNENSFEYRLEQNIGYRNNVQIDKEYNLKLNDTTILSDVTAFNLLSNYNGKNSTVMVIRKDGTIWSLVLNGTAKLTKIKENSGRAIFADNSNMTSKMSTFEIEAYPPRTREILTGFDVRKLAVKDALASSNFQEGYKAKAFKAGKELEDNQKISTGATIKILNSKDEVVSEYTALVYGDVTGKGNPGVADALMIVKNKLGKIKIEGNLFMEAGRVTPASRKTGGIPSVADALAIIKAKLGRYEISK